MGPASSTVFLNLLSSRLSSPPVSINNTASVQFILFELYGGSYMLFARAIYSPLKTCANQTAVGTASLAVRIVSHDEQLNAKAEQTACSNGSATLLALALKANEPSFGIAWLHIEMTPFDWPKCNVAQTIPPTTDI
jgi:hypothetical protein